MTTKSFHAKLNDATTSLEKLLLQAAAGRGFDNAKVYLFGSPGADVVIAEISLITRENGSLRGASVMRGDAMQEEPSHAAPLLLACEEYLAAHLSRPHETRDAWIHEITETVSTLVKKIF